MKILIYSIAFLFTPLVLADTITENTNLQQKIFNQNGAVQTLNSKEMLSTKAGYGERMCYWIRPGDGSEFQICITETGPGQYIIN